MAPQTLNLTARLKTLNVVLVDKKDQKAVKNALQTNNGDLSATLESLKGKLPDVTLQKVAFAYSMAELSGDNMSIVKAVVVQPDISTLRDVALKYNPEELAGLIDDKAVPANMAGDTPDDKRLNFANELHNKLF